jgi:hypothetical protein
MMTRLRNRTTATVVFVRPNGVPTKWEETDLWYDAQQIPFFAHALMRHLLMWHREPFPNIDAVVGC